MSDLPQLDAWAWCTEEHMLMNTCDQYNKEGNDGNEDLADPGCIGNGKAVTHANPDGTENEVARGQKRLRPPAEASRIITVGQLRKALQTFCLMEHC